MKELTPQEALEILVEAYSNETTLNGYEKMKPVIQVLEQALTTPLPSEVEEAYNNILEGYSQSKDTHNLSKHFDTLRQALRLQPHRTKEQYIEEIIDWLNKLYMLDQNVKVSYLERSNAFSLYKPNWEKVIALNSKGNLYTDINLPLPIAKLIIDFFTEYGDKE